jgi:chorismate mutase
MVTPAERKVRAVRGATTVERDEAMLVCDATRELLIEMLSRNAATADDVISAVFTVSPDLRSEFPARAARDLGWDHVAMLCTTEMPVPGAMERCVRVMLHVELTGAQRDVKHAYLRQAAGLRPDLTEPPARG